MKTFQEFILESTIQQLRSQANAARQRGDMETFIKLQKQAAELGTGTQAKISAATSDKPKKPSDPNSITGGGYAQTGRSRRARIDQDTLPGQSNIADPRDDRMARKGQTYTGRYGNQHGQTGSGGKGTDRTGASRLGGRP
jgi:hypothetical protein